MLLLAVRFHRRRRRSIVNLDGLALAIRACLGRPRQYFCFNVAHS